MSNLAGNNGYAPDNTSIDLNASAQLQIVPPAASTAISSVTSTTLSTATTYKMMGLGSTYTYKPIKTGKVLIIISGAGGDTNSATNTLQIQAAFGTGTAPANATAATGTTAGLPALITGYTGLTSSNGAQFTLPLLITSTANTAIWFDLQVLSPGGASSIKLENLNLVMIEQLY